MIAFQKEAQTDRVQVCLRMSPEDRRLIGQAAQACRQSLNSFILGAAIDRARRRAQVEALAESDNAEMTDALTVLTTAGMTRQEAERRVGAILAEHPQASADEVVASAFRMGAVR